MNPTDQVLENIAQKLPDGITAEQVFNRLIVQSAPSVTHQRIIFDILKSLDETYNTHSASMRKYNRCGWEFTFGARMNIPESIGGAGAYFVPDIMGWRREYAISSIPHIDPITIEDLSKLRPVWVCEVLSTNAKFDLEIKLPIYQQMLIEHIWIIDSRSRSIEVHANELTRYTRKHHTTSVARIEPFQEMLLDLTELFS